MFIVLFEIALNWNIVYYLWMHRFKKKGSIICSLQETHFSSKDTNRNEVNGMEDIPCKKEPKESKDSHTYMTQNRF